MKSICRSKHSPELATIFPPPPPHSMAQLKMKMPCQWVERIFRQMLLLLLLLFPLLPTEAVNVDSSQLARLQGVGVQGRLLCGKVPLKGAKVKIVDLDPRPDRDDLMGEFLTDENGLFQVSGATREETDIEVVLKVYHDCLDEQRPCQRRTVWKVPAKYYNNGTLEEWLDIGSVNMELVFPGEERDCRH